MGLTENPPSGNPSRFRRPRVKRLAIGTRISLQKGPLFGFGTGLSRSRTGGPARVAQCPHERRSDARGRCLFAHRGKPGWYSGSGAVLEAPGLVAGFDDFAVMGQPVEQRRGHFGVAEDAWPFAEGEIGGDNGRGALVELADQMKEELAAGLSEGQMPSSSSTTKSIRVK
jgi:hypothetical protein